RDRPMRRHPDVVGRPPDAGESCGPFVHQLRAGEGGHDARMLESGRRVDAHDPGIGEGAAHNRYPEHSRQSEIVEERGLPEQQVPVLPARDALADIPRSIAGARHDVSPGDAILSLAAWTARTIPC